MACKCGIVGLPNVGKSTLYNALTSAAIAAENYPFCTIEPNVGVVSVPDHRLQQLADLVHPEQVIPATVEFVDIAGLVAGASRGEGLGNQFLAHIRETQAIIQVVRCFEDSNIAHVAGTVNPLSDVEVIATELCLADQETVDKAIQKNERLIKTGNKEAKQTHELLEQLLGHLDSGQPLRTFQVAREQRVLLRDLHLLTDKPVLYVANTTEEGMLDENNDMVQALRQHADSEQAMVIPVCAAFEAEVSQLDDVAERQDFLQAAGMKKSGLERVIQAAYRLLSLQTFFTAGTQEVRAWTVPQGVLAPQAAGVIHSDFERGFIRAEVAAFDDYIAAGGEAGVKAAGKWRSEGKEYPVAEGDVILFRFHV